MEQTFNHPIQYVLFDLGNTLIYFDGCWKDVLEEANVKMVKSLAQGGYSLNNSEFTSEFTNRLQRYYLERDINFKEVPTSAILKSLLAENGYTQIPEADIKNALEIFYKATEAHWKIEADTISLLEALKENKINLGVISNASNADNVKRLIDNAKIRHFFDLIYISAEFGIRKPHPKIFESALAKWNTNSSHCIMVGDTLSSDIVGANKIGMRSIWINRRVPNATKQVFDVDNKPTFIVGTLAEIINVIEDINH